MMLKDKLLKIKSNNQYWIRVLNNDEIKELYEKTMFLPEDTSNSIRRIYVIKEYTAPRLCPVCGKMILKLDYTGKNLSVFCSNECKKSEAGKRIVSEKRKNTNNIKFGTDNPFQNKDIKKKSKETNKEKYDCEYYTQTEEYKERYKKTCLEKYNEDNIAKSPEIQNKIKRKRRENYWNLFILLLSKKFVEPLFDKEEYLSANNGDILKFKCLKCDNIFEFVVKSGQGIEVKDITCQKHKYRSNGEYEIISFLRSLKENIVIQQKRFYF